MSETTDETAGQACQHGKGDPPMDCDWPGCGCDPEANRIMPLLRASGWRDRYERDEEIAATHARGVVDGIASVAKLAGQMAEEHRARAARRIGDAARRFEEGAADALDALRKHLEGGERG